MANGQDKEMLKGLSGAVQQLQGRLARLEGERAALAKSMSASVGGAATAGQSAIGTLNALQGRVYSLEQFRLSQTVRPSMPREVIKPRQISVEEAVATLAAIAGGPGVDVTDNVVSADLADDPGLEFDAVGVDGKVRVKPNAAKAIVREAAGVGALLAADPGLEFDGVNGVRVKPNAAKAIVREAAGVGVGLAANPGLEFDGVNGVRVKADAGGAIQRSADGVGLVDGTAADQITRWTGAAWAVADPAEITVVTAFQVTGVTLQVKTRTVKVVVAGAESAWTTVHTGNECP